MIFKGDVVNVDDMDDDHDDDDDDDDGILTSLILCFGSAPNGRRSPKGRSWAFVRGGRWHSKI